MPQRPECHVVLPDVHTPWHDRDLLPAILQFIKDIRPQGVVLSGDFLDLYSLSTHQAGSLYHLKDINLSYEYQIGREVMRQIESVSKQAKRVFLFGNHEDRYKRWIATEDHAKLGTELGSPTEALRARENGWRVIEEYPDGFLKLGDHLEIIHGIYCPMHAAKKHLDMLQGSVVFGHTHRIQSYTTGRREAWNIGHLSDPDSKGMSYMPRTQKQQWSQGFAVVYILTSGDFVVNPVAIWEGQFVWAGKIYGQRKNKPQ